jgi:molybdenum cofactor biosynthesis enzyme MoaA
VGAEPTTRNDLPEIIESIRSIFSKDRTVLIVSNGINLGKNRYASKFEKIPDLKWTIGLNHPEYNGGKIRKKQEKGIENAVKYGLEIKSMTYTLEHITDVDFVLWEMEQWRDKKICNNARVQLGVEIGKTPEDEHEYFLSELVNYVIEKCKKENKVIQPRPDISSRTHYAIDIGDITYRFIKWCDVRTINFEETQSESWAQLIPHKPMSNLLHQVILRDRFINKGLPLLDTVPSQYTNKDVEYSELKDYFIANK